MEDPILQIRSLKSNIKPLVVPLLIISLVVILLIISVPVVYKRVSTSFKEISDSREELARLEQKTLTLRDIQSNILPQTSETVLALPDKNPALYKYNVIRSVVAEQTDLQIAGFESANESVRDSEVNSMILTVKYLGGSIDQMMNVLSSVLDTIPYTTIRDFAYSNDPDPEFEVSYAVYWSDLPKTIAKIAEPVNELNQDEIATLNQLTALTKPDFVKVEKTSYPERVSPFR